MDEKIENMEFDFIKMKERDNIIPYQLELKEQYYLDIMNIEHSWSGRMDAMYSSEFFREAAQLIVNAIVLFEMGYFDSAFYSLRQALEISTTIVYFIDDDKENSAQEMKKWKRQERFPMNNQMIHELQKRQATFAEVKNKMSKYFEEIEATKQQLNKYVHKQGYDKFYVTRANSINGIKKEKLAQDFEMFLKKCMGAIAVFRLVIDPFPLLLMDDEIYNRTEQLITEGFSIDFVEKYIGTDHINAYKQTEFYKSHYEVIILNERMLPSVSDVVKNDYVDNKKIDEILTQSYLLGTHGLVAVVLFSFSNKIAKVYCIGGFHYYFSEIRSNRIRRGWGSADFDVFKTGEIKYNVPFEEAYLSCINVRDEEYYIEHNEKFDESEILALDKISKSKLEENA
jgi:hypothetical protein